MKVGLHGYDTRGFCRREMWLPQIININVDIDELPDRPSSYPVDGCGRYFVFLKKKHMSGFFMRNVYRMKSKKNQIMVENASEMIAPAFSRISGDNIEELQEDINALHKKGFMVISPHQDNILTPLDHLKKNGVSVDEIGFFETSFPFHNCRAFFHTRHKEMIVRDRHFGTTPDANVFFYPDVNSGKFGRKPKVRSFNCQPALSSSYHPESEKSATERMIALNYAKLGVNQKFKYSRYLKLCKQLNMTEYELRELICMPIKMHKQFQACHTKGDITFDLLPKIFKLKIVELELYLESKFTGIPNGGISVRYTGEVEDLPDPFKGFEKTKIEELEAAL